MPRDHTRVNIDIWGDDDFRDLPVDAQNLYWTLWTSPARTYCGAHEWRPGKLTQCAEDWTVPRILASGAVLSQRLFLVIDDLTEECLLRSWIKHDGLWRIPNMAVTMANARSALGSKALRGVIVHEVKKLVKAEPTLGSWARDEVKKLLSQKAIDPASLEPFNPGPNGGVNPAANPPVNPYGENDVNPPPNPAPTTTTATPLLTTTTKEGYVSQVCHQEPASRCPAHVNHPKPPNCGDCADARRTHKAWEDDELEQKRRRNAALVKAASDCTFCDEGNWLVDEYGKPVEPAQKCTRHLEGLEQRHA